MPRFSRDALKGEGVLPERKSVAPPAPATDSITKAIQILAAALLAQPPPVVNVASPSMPPAPTPARSFRITVNRDSRGFIESFDITPRKD